MDQDREEAMERPGPHEPASVTPRGRKEGKDKLRHAVGTSRGGGVGSGRCAGNQLRARRGRRAF